MAPQKSKKAQKFIIDCSKPIADNIIDIGSFVSNF